jgi:predicted ester cyclase
MQEPRDGDFVAYIDALQRESAARLAQQHVGVTETTAASKTTGQFFEEKSKPAAGPNLQQSVERFVRDPDARIVKAVVAGVAGGVFLLAWLGDGGPFSFIVAVVLLAYAVPRVLRAFRAVTAQPTNRTTIEQVFGRSGTQKPGTGR